MRQHKPQAGQGAFSILALDDDPIMTSTVQAYFQRSGYHVDVENDPCRAIERIRAGHYDILLLDFLMTPICGDQVVEQVRQFNQDLFIILLTGHKSMVPPIKTIRALDIQGYYEKSDRFDQLELLVESCAKSIRQMRTINSYKDGLSAILDCLPRMYGLRTLDGTAGSILAAAVSLLPCAGVVLALDAGVCHTPAPVQGERRFVFRCAGERYTPLDDGGVQALLRQLSGHSPLILDRQLVLPLLDNEQQAMGLLSVELYQPPQYDQIQLMAVFARQASAALCSAQLHCLVQEKNSQLDRAYTRLNDSYLEMVSTIRLMVDARDTYTRGHSDRVSAYSLFIARQLGRPEAFCQRIRLAGLFHDIGKLSVSDEILLKPDKLTDQEYEVIKTHSRRGADILSAITQFRDIVPWVLSHHERYDGRGYPQGLGGTDIPEAARIIAVADSFDAMTSDRQYRKSLSFDQAMAELERGRGGQFDPQVVQAFQALARQDDFWTRIQEEIDHVPCPAAQV